MKLTETQKGYVAGILDGEGSFIFYRGVSYNKDGSSWERFVPVIVVEMTDSRVIRYLAGLFDRPVKSRKRGGNKRTYTVDFHPTALRKLLPQVQDLFITKKEQSVLISKWLELFGFNTKYAGFANQRIELQRMFYTCCRLLNRRGPRKPGELKGNLSNETILSQALEEIWGKVQRLRYEAKEIKKNSVLGLIKERGRVSKKDLYRLTHCRNVVELNAILADIPIISYLENRTTYYVHASNDRTSAGDQSERHLRLVSNSDYDIVRATG